MVLLIDNLINLNIIPNVLPRVKSHSFLTIPKGTSNPQISPLLQMPDHSYDQLYPGNRKTPEKVSRLGCFHKIREFLDQQVNKHLADYNQEISKDTDHTPLNF